VAFLPITVPRASAQPLDRRRLLLVGLYILALAITAELLWMTLVRFRDTKGTDFLVVHEAAGAVLRGRSPYVVREIAGDLFGANFHLPPFAAVVILPLALLGPDPALMVWRVISLAAHFGALVLLLRALRVPWSSPLAPLALGVWAFSWPARFTFIHGQWDAIFLLLLSAAWWAETRGWGVAAGSLLAVGGSIKPYPLLVAGYFGARRRWGAVLGAVATAMLLVGLGYLAAGPRTTDVFLRQVIPHLGATTGYPENQSIAGFLSRWIEPEFRAEVAASPAVYVLSRVALVALLVPLALLGLRAPGRPYGAALQYAAWVAPIPSVIPTAWLHYQQMLLLPFLVLAAAWWLGDRRPGPIAIGLYLVALVLVNFGDHYTALGPLAGELWKTDQRSGAANAELLGRFAGPAMLLVSYKLYGALILFGLCLREAWRATTWEGRPRSIRAFLLPRPAEAALTLAHAQGETE
jgi:alpha-1,2-mannosyltransferase